MGEAADRLQHKLESLIERAAKALILEVNRELRRKGTGTPVDTGHARAAWIPAVGAPSLVEPVGADSSLASAGTAQVMGFKLGQGMLYLSNVAPYIGRLNNGWSQRAPALFVERAIATAMQTVRAKTGVDFGVDAFAADIGGDAAANMAEAFSPF
jgi:hypothetical protein